MLTIYILLTCHFIGDFLCQTDWMALNKSHNWKALTLHVFVYSLWFIGFGLPFMLVTFVTHWMTDFVTSRITAYFYRHEQRRYFFCTIGFDQLIHYVTLLSTLYLPAYLEVYGIHWTGGIL